MSHKGELHVTFIGSPHKSVIFEQLKSAAVKTEKHVSYHDTYYFTFDVDGTESVVELVDPGVEHTGAREMSIRKAQGAMLFYSAYSSTSFEQISDLVNDFSYHKNSTKLPVLLVCIEDEIMDDGCETSSTGHSSVSEGYESETPHATSSESHWKRRPSMEKIRAGHEEGKLTREKGVELASQMPADCTFMPVTLASFNDGAKLMEEMIRKIRDRQGNKRRGLQSLIKNRKSQEAAKPTQVASVSQDSVGDNTKTDLPTKGSAVCTIS